MIKVATLRSWPLVATFVMAMFVTADAEPRPGRLQSTAEWGKTITCPADRVYRDIRRDAGRQEYCGLSLPGELEVMDGPFRSWFSPGHPGREGAYRMGRQVGLWTECDRFDRCRKNTYEFEWEQERARTVKPDIPLTFSRGKYVFDFGACWSTQIRSETAGARMEIVIGHGLFRCDVSFMPMTNSGVPSSDRRHYVCRVPFSVGIREFASLDLRAELPRVGLPQFCRKDEPDATTPMPDGLPATAWAMWTAEPFTDERTNRTTTSWTPLAEVVDVECAAISPQPSGPDVLTIRLNEFVERLVLNRAGKHEVKADMCGGRFPLSPMEPTRDDAGRTLFRYRLSAAAASAKRQRNCIAAQVPLQAVCTRRAGTPQRSR